MSDQKTPDAFASTEEGHTSDHMHFEPWSSADEIEMLLTQQILAKKLVCRYAAGRSELADAGCMAPGNR